MRKSKLTKEALETIIACIKQGNFREVAAKVAGIHPETFKRWMREPGLKYEMFQKAVIHAEAEVEARAIAKIVDTGHMDDVKWLAWWLERKNPKWNSGIYRWELQLVQKQVKELNKVINELQEVKQKLDANANSSTSVEKDLEANFGQNPN